MNTILGATSLISALFIISIIIGLYQVPKDILQATQNFRLCMWLTFCGLILEILAYFYDGRPDLSVFVFAVNYLAVVLLDLLVIVYVFYLHDLISESEQNFSKKFCYVISALCVFDMIASTVLSANGKLFTVNEGTFVRGPWFEYIELVPGICLFLMFILYILKFKSFRIKSHVFVVMIVLVPVLGTVLVKMDTNIRYGYVVAALSMNVIYAIIQTRVITESVAKAMMYSEISNNDFLTGLKNRRGYQEVINSITYGKNVGVAFVDINSLKYVNDNLGHEAGDQLIKKVADIMTTYIPNGNVCRMSGDEFVIIVENTDEVRFSNEINELQKKLYDEGRIAALGHSFGKGCDILKLLNDAEKRMYDDKEKYYKETGKDRRR